MKKGVLVLLFLAALLLLNSDAIGCTCAPAMPVESAFARSSAVFAGRVRDTQRSRDATGPFRNVEVVFAVEKRWKGEGGSEQVVLTPSSSAACGYDFEKGVNYVVYANADTSGNLITGLCTRTARATLAGEDIKELNRLAGASGSPLPKWLSDHFGFMTSGTGRWITSNSKFKSETEPFDEYGTEWKWGVGKSSLNGRLFGLNRGKEVGDFWEYRIFWHPQEKKAVFQQFGAGGVYGVGEMREVKTDAVGPEISLEMVFYSPDGLTWRDLHKLTESTREHTTVSFSFKDGDWQPRRRYVWRLATR